MIGFNTFKASLLLLVYVVIQLCEGRYSLDARVNHSDQTHEEAVIDMGIDYNDEPVTDYMRDLMTQALVNDNVTNAYGSSLGTPRLLEAIAVFYSNLIPHKLDPTSEIITTVGATEALSSTLKALSKPGDEWILIEPFFNLFKNEIERAGAVPRYTNLKPTKRSGVVTAEDWKLDRWEMESLVNPKTRGILFNNPNNPVGKTYSRSDLEFVARLAKRNNLIVVSDEVHEFTTDSMIKMASLPGMFDRTVTIGSASKAFCVPGWRIGWVFGPSGLIRKIIQIHGDVVNFVSTAQQVAVARIFEDEYKNFGSADSFLSRNLASVKRKREFIVEKLRDASMQPIVPQGGYCMLAEWPKLSRNGPRILSNATFTDWIQRVIRVRAFAAGKYYGDRHRLLGQMLRFCYHKKNETLKAAAKHLKKLTRYVFKHTSAPYGRC